MKSRVPKKEVPINPINPRGGLGCSLCLRTEIERISLNFCPFEAVFSGIGRDFCFTEPGIFLYFISHTCIVTLFEQANKMMII